MILPGRGLVTSRDIVRSIWGAMTSDPKYKGFFDEVVSNKGDGEDILFNHVFRTLPGLGGGIRRVAADDAAFKQMAQTGGGFSVTSGGSGQPHHEALRKKFCRDLAASAESAAPTLQPR